MPAKAKKSGSLSRQQIKDRIDRHELDLSLCELSEVPVKDLVRSLQMLGNFLKWPAFIGTLSLSVGGFPEDNCVRSIMQHLVRVAGKST